MGEVIYRTETDSQMWRTDGVAKGKGFGKDTDWEFGSAEANHYKQDG